MMQNLIPMRSMEMISKKLLNAHVISIKGEFVTDCSISLHYDTSNVTSSLGSQCVWCGGHTGTGLLEQHVTLDA